MRFPILSTVLIALAVLASPVAGADGLPSFETAAEKIQSVTVTVRIGRTGKQQPTENKKKSSLRVTVFSGVSLGDGLLVTPLFTSTRSRIRITLTGGGQAEAIPLVFDEHSGLALLEIDRKDIPGITLAKAPPKIGSWVMSAAGWGVEKPVVSLGIVAGVDRKLPGANYPPLLQCDLRTAETSSGAGVVNRDGQLLGMVVAAQHEQKNRGWTYAVPVQHVQRLLRAQAEKTVDNKKKILVVQDRRPVVGMVLDGEPGRVVVQRVSKGSPAEKAGVKPGDLILEAAGTKIRAVYQAVRPILYKRPGDKITFVVKQKDGVVRPIEIVLGGGVVLPGAPRIDLANVLQPKVIVGANALDIARTAKQDINQAFAEKNGPQKNTDPQKILERALDSYLRVIETQQKQIEALRTEIDALKKKMNDPADSK